MKKAHLEEKKENWRKKPYKKLTGVQKFFIRLMSTMREDASRNRGHDFAVSSCVSCSRGIFLLSSRRKSYLLSKENMSPGRQRVSQ
jgi:hypothetical protein